MEDQQIPKNKCSGQPEIITQSETDKKARGLRNNPNLLLVASACSCRALSKLPFSLGTAHAPSYITAFSCGCKMGYWIAKHPPRYNYKIIILHYIETNPAGNRSQSKLWTAKQARSFLSQQSPLIRFTATHHSCVFVFFSSLPVLYIPLLLFHEHTHARTPSPLVGDCCASIYEVRQTNC